MQRVLQSARLGPHRLDVIEYADDEGGGFVVVAIDGVVVTEPLPDAPATEDLMSIYAGWKTSGAGALRTRAATAPDGSGRGR